MDVLLYYAIFLLAVQVIGGAHMWAESVLEDPNSGPVSRELAKIVAGIVLVVIWAILAAPLVWILYSCMTNGPRPDWDCSMEYDKLPRAVGKAKAMDMALTGRMMDATEAERAGLVSRVVPLDKLMDEALGAALQVCEFSQIAVLAAKESVNRAFEGGLSDGLMFERRLFHALFSTADQKEGMDAFLNKRKAQFRNH